MCDVPKMYSLFWAKIVLCVSLGDGIYIYSGDSSTMGCSKEGKEAQSLEELHMLLVVVMLAVTYLELSSRFFT